MLRSIAIGLFMVLLASCAISSTRLTKAFEVLTQESFAARGIPTSLREDYGKTVRIISLQEIPSTRWNPKWGSYPKYVAETLRALGDKNARYVAPGRLRVTYGPREILVDTLDYFGEELEVRGLELELVTVSRDINENASVHGDVNSDHMIGLAADARILLLPCGEDPTSEECIPAMHPSRKFLEIQLRIMEAAVAAGVQQLNMYDSEFNPTGQRIHVGVSPFRNGSPGEMLGNVDATGTRRIGYGGAQKGSLGTLTPEAARYIGIFGTPMADVFQKLLHNPPPEGYEAVYEAIRERNLSSLPSLL